MTEQTNHRTEIKQGDLVWRVEWTRYRDAQGFFEIKYHPSFVEKISEDGLFIDVIDAQNKKDYHDHRNNFFTSKQILQFGILSREDMIEEQKKYERSAA